MAKKVIAPTTKATPKIHEIIRVRDELLFAHPNNTNKQSKHVHQELVESIQQHGFDEPIIIIPRRDATPGYFIVSGNHRRLAGKAAGMEEFPCVLRDDWDEVEGRIQLVRRNFVRGEIDRTLFTEEINRLTVEHQLGLDIIMERMGFEDAESFSEFYKQEQKRERSIASAVASQNQVSQVKMIDDLGVIISVLFEKYGKTVPHSFMVFPLGGRNHTFVQSTPALKKTLDAIALHCVATGMDFNTVMGGLLQVAIHQTKLFSPDSDKSVILKEGSVDGETNFNLVHEETKSSKS